MVCNGGADVVIASGETFTCKGSDGKTFTVHLADDQGTYYVEP